MNVQIPRSKNAGSQLCFLHIRQGQGVSSRGRMNPEIQQ